MPVTPSVLPYLGDDFQRSRDLGAPSHRRCHGTDRSGTVDYHFNTLGFRGPELDLARPWRIAVFGESHAFGAGVAFEATWAARFAAGWAERHGVAADDVCLANFGEPGLSNEAIARHVVAQSRRFRPHLVLVHFAEPYRCETRIGDRPVRLGRWLMERAVRRSVRRMPEGLLGRAEAQEWLRRGSSYLRFVNGVYAAAATLRSMLLVQLYCRANGWPAVASAQCWTELRAMTDAAPALRPLHAQLSDAFVNPVPIHAAGDDDRAAADGRHAGPRCHAGLASVLLQHVRVHGLDPFHPSPPST